MAYLCPFVCVPHSLESVLTPSLPHHAGGGDALRARVHVLAMRGSDSALHPPGGDMCADVRHLPLAHGCSDGH
eukprot:545575-Pyramimonas_sp.AAC.1